jgi:chemotaxis protein methyltransferase CheR
METGEFALTDREFERVRERVYRIAGISLSDAKRTLVISRLSRTLRILGIRTFSDYLDRLDDGADAEEQQNFINALTTNLTRFWREDHHFEHLVSQIRALLRHPPRLSRDGRPRVRIWSAGCSTGQEPYTIAVDLYAQVPELKRCDFRVLATDIDTAVLAKAATGIYPEGELNGLSKARIALLERTPEGKVRIPALARDAVSFKPLNLMDHPWPMRGPFDAIFCRNVAIYFDRPTQAQLFNRLGALLTPEGNLYVGHSENVVSEEFRLVGKTTYEHRSVRKRDAA